MTWTFENESEKIQFLYTIIKLLPKEDQKKVPKFVNFDETMVTDLMVAKLNANNKKSNKDDDEGSQESFIQDLNDEFEEGKFF